MCGIVGYIGHRTALSILLSGLERLEYRGYDSAGVAIHQDNTVVTVKEKGKMVELEKKIKGIKPKDVKVKKKSPPKFFRVLNKAKIDRKIGFGQLIDSIFGTKGEGTVGFNSFLSGLQGKGIKIKEKYALEVMGFIKKGKDVSLGKLKEKHAEILTG